MRRLHLLHLPIGHENNSPISIRLEVKYFGLRLLKKRKLRAHNLSNEKLIVYKTILKLIWRMGLSCGVAPNHSSTNILQTFQFKIFRIIMDAPRYVANKNIHDGLALPFITDVTASAHAIRNKYLITNHEIHLIIT